MPRYCNVSRVGGRQAAGGPRHRMVTAAGIRWHDASAGTGPAVVLVAGYPQSSYAWRHVLALLVEDHEVHAVDLPGQGYSDIPAGGYDTATTSNRLHSLTAELGLDCHVLVGHDIGAWVGYPYAHRYADELRGLVLRDANIPGVTLSPTLTLGSESNWRNWHFLFNDVDDLPEAVLQGRERLLIEWFFRRKAADWVSTFTDADIDEYVQVYSRPGALRGMLGYYRAVLTDIEQNRELMNARLGTPVLALGGEVGSAPDLFAKMKPLAIDVRGGVIASSGHYIPEEQPQALATRIRDFVTELGR